MNDVATEGIVDRIDRVKRRLLMQRIRTKNTAPEVNLRQLLHAAGYRFRLHRNDLPGTPDIVLPRYRVAIFVHGCFWHGHSCKKGSIPKTNAEFWTRKMAENRHRDERKSQEIAVLGWTPVTVWECELQDPKALIRRLRRMTLRGVVRQAQAGSKG